MTENTSPAAAATTSATASVDAPPSQPAHAAPAAQSSPAASAQAAPAHSAPPLLPSKAPLVRPYQGRMFAGVCRGIATHLGVNVWLVRLVFLVLTVVFGLGLVAYLFLWVALPSVNALYFQPFAPAYAEGTQRAAQSASEAPAASRSAVYAATVPRTTAPAAYDTAGYVDHVGATLGQAFAPSAASAGASAPSAVPQPAASQPAAPVTSQPAPKATPASLIWNTISIVCVGLIIIFLGFDWAIEQHILSPVIAVEVTMAALCALAVWLYFDRAQKGRILVTTAALAAFILGIFILLVVLYGRRTGLPMFGVFIIGIFSAAIIAAPWLAHAHQKIAEETAQKEREEQRADMAAHLHDSVLQTLNLIRQNAQNADAVAQLARTQERELRRWLYEGHESESVSLASSMKLVAGRVEDTFGTPVEVITVGDVQPSEATNALVSATQQALTNACTHGAAPISLYVESSADAVSVFVRDHGSGFDVSAIPEDRLGVRESIIGRVERAGGTVDVVSRAGWGTEVRMSLPLKQ